MELPSSLLQLYKVGDLWFKKQVSVNHFQILIESDELVRGLSHRKVLGTLYRNPNLVVQ